MEKTLIQNPKPETSISPKVNKMTADRKIGYVKPPAQRLKPIDRCNFTTFSLLPATPKQIQPTSSLPLGRTHYNAHVNSLAKALNMRCSRIISQFLYRRFTPIYQNPTRHLYQKSISSLYTVKNFNFSGKSLYFAREFTSESKIAPSERVSSIVDEISGLTLLEVSDLTEVLRKKLDIKEMPVMGVMMPGMGFGMKGAAKGGGAAKGEEKVAEKTAFDLKLEGGFDASAKIKVIKEVRACTDLGLKEAKDLVERAPTLLKKGVSKEEGEKIIAKLGEVGAKVKME